MSEREHEDLVVLSFTAADLQLLWAMTCMVQVRGAGVDRLAAMRAAIRARASSAGIHLEDA